MTASNRIIRSISYVLLGVILFQGCTSYHIQDVRISGEIEELNQKGTTENSRVYMQDGYKYSAAKLTVEPDTTLWYAGEGVLPVERPTADINKVIFIDRPRGALDAFLFGAIPGFVMGGLFAFSMSYGMGGQDLDSATGIGLAYALGGGLITGLMAVPVGWIVGHREVYDLYDSTLDGDE